MCQWSGIDGLACNNGPLEHHNIAGVCLEDGMHSGATSVPQCRTAGPDAGLSIPTHVLGVKRPNTSDSIGLGDDLL